MSGGTRQQVTCSRFKAADNLARCPYARGEGGVKSACAGPRTAVRAHGVVVRPPCPDDPSHRRQRREQVRAKTFVAQARIRRFHKVILWRISNARETLYL